MKFTKQSRNRIEMPLIGYGTYQLSTSQAESCVAEALNAGFAGITRRRSYTVELPLLTIFSFFGLLIPSIRKKKEMAQ